MRPSLLALLVAVGSLAFAGCLGAPEAAPVPPQSGDGGDMDYGDIAMPNPPADEPARAFVEVYPFAGKLTAAVGAAGVGYASPTGAQDTHIFTFNVLPGAVAVVAELAWADPVQDLDLEVGAPSCDSAAGVGACFFHDGGSPGSGDSPVRFVVTDGEALAEEGGAWRTAVWAKNGVNVDFHGAISVFYDAPPGDDYTALGP